MAGRVAAPLGAPHAQAWLHFGTGCEQMLSARPHEALESRVRAEELFRDGCVGLARELGSVRRVTLVPLSTVGDLRAIQACRSDWLPDAEELHRLAFALDRASSCLAWLASDQPERARQSVVEAERDWGRAAAVDSLSLSVTLARVRIDAYERRGAALDAAARPEARTRRFARSRQRLVGMYLPGVEALLGDAAAPGGLSWLALGS